MSLIRLASTETVDLPIGDDGDIVTVRKELSRRERNNLVVGFPVFKEGDTLTPEQGLAFQKVLFESLVTGWSADLPCNIETYEALPPAVSDLIDKALADHFAAMMPSAEETKKA